MPHHIVMGINTAPAARTFQTMRTPVSLILLLLWPGLLLWPVRSDSAPPARTTLSDATIPYLIPDAPYVVLRRGELEAVVVDNRAVDDAVLPGHRGGYHGVASLKHARQSRNLFVPAYSGLNFEHIHDGTTQSHEVLFEPRRAPMELRVINAHTAELYQPPTPHWGVESCARYELLEGGVIELTFEAIPRRPTWNHDYLGFFWASYIDQPESLDIHFPGVTAQGGWEWVRGTTPRHGVEATHRAVQDERNLAHDRDFPLSLVFNFSRHRVAQPWYFGVSRGMAFAQMFRPADQVRFSQSPSGGGQGNPAWDFQWFIPQPQVDQRYQLVMRALYTPLPAPSGIATTRETVREAVGRVHFAPSHAGLPSGAGLAARYPGDVGIEHDPRVLFAENFESGSLAELGQRWESVSNEEGKVLAFSEQAPPGSPGQRSLEMTATLGENTGGHLYTRLPRGADQVFARFYVKFAEESEYIHHFVTLGGYRPPTPWPQGGAGQRPLGDERFTAGIEPFGGQGRYPAPGAWNFYAYWSEMKVSAGGRYWGNSLTPVEPALAPRGRWQCVEMMLRCNDPDRSNGALALWIDGKLVADFSPGVPRSHWTGLGFSLLEEGGEPFEGFRWRTRSDLQVNFFWLLHYVTENAARQNRVDHPDPVNRVWFDHIVLSTEYVGPLAE